MVSDDLCSFLVFLFRPKVGNVPWRSSSSVGMFYGYASSALQDLKTLKSSGALSQSQISLMQRWLLTVVSDLVVTWFYSLTRLCKTIRKRKATTNDAESVRPL